MDPLSDVLSLLKPRRYLSGGIDAGGAWSIQFPRHEGIKCYAVASGDCWLALDGADQATHLTAGDCFLLPSGRPFRLASELDAPPLDYGAVFAEALNGGVVHVNGGGDVFLVGGYFGLTGHQADLLLGVLPPIVHLRKEPDKAMLRGSLDRLQQELREQRPGYALVVQQLAYVLMVQALRLHLTDPSSGGIGWLFALADPPMNAAISAMHNDPAHRWTVQALAACAGMSRTSFTLRFIATVGVSPMLYLRRWRMLLAADRLTDSSDSSDSIATIAWSLGYESESSFSTAFKRVMMCSPRQYSRSPTPTITARRVPAESSRSPIDALESAA